MFAQVYGVGIITKQAAKGYLKIFKKKEAVCLFVCLKPLCKNLMMLRNVLIFALSDVQSIFCA